MGVAPAQGSFDLNGHRRSGLAFTGPDGARRSWFAGVGGVSSTSEPRRWTYGFARRRANGRSQSGRSCRGAGHLRTCPLARIGLPEEIGEDPRDSGNRERLSTFAPIRMTAVAARALRLHRDESPARFVNEPTPRQNSMSPIRATVFRAAPIRSCRNLVHAGVADFVRHRMSACRARSRGDASADGADGDGRKVRPAKPEQRTRSVSPSEGHDERSVHY
jgi:hypothetical protein